MPEIIVKLGDNIVHKYIFDKEIMSVGRARDNDIVIENLSVSRNHARIRKENERFILTDLNSANGTYVNGVKVTRVEIVNEDVVTIGKHKIHFVDKTAGEEELVGEAFGAERTMLVDRTQTGHFVVTKGKQKEQEFKVSKYETFIGRANDNDIRLHDWFVSKKHAVVIRQGSNFFIKDLGSWRGTLVNGKTVRDCELKDGDEVQLGTTSLSFTLEGEGAAPQITGRVPHEIDYDDPRSDLSPAAVGARSPEGVNEEDFEPLDENWEEELAPLAPAQQSPSPAPRQDPAAQQPHRGPEDEFAPLTEDELLELEAEEQEIVEEPVAQQPEEPAEIEASPPEPEQPEEEFEALDEEPEEEEEVYESEEERFAASLRHEDEESGVSVPGLESREDDLALGEDLFPREEAKPEAAQAENPVAEAEDLVEDLVEEVEDLEVEADAGEPVAVQEEERPSPPEQEPAPSEPEPAPSEPEPAPSEPEPAPSEPEPAPSEPEPAPSEPEPAPSEPAAAAPFAVKPPAGDEAEIAVWHRGLRNKSRIIRREAARKLKQLTGRDYDWESTPE